MLLATLGPLTEADAVPQLVLVLEVQHVLQLGLQGKVTSYSQPVDWPVTTATGVPADVRGTV